MEGSRASGWALQLAATYLLSAAACTDLAPLPDHRRLGEPPLGEPAGQHEQRLVGGKAAAAGEFAAVGAVLRTSHGTPARLLCTGVLISPAFVLTAAHCVAGISEPVSPEEMVLFVGVDLEDDPAPAWLLPIANVHLHPDFAADRTPPRGLSDYHDIALLRLAQPTELAAPLPLIGPAAAAETLVPGRQLLLVGFGRSEAADGTSAGIKRSGTSELSELGLFELLVNATDSPQKCIGDSGSPALLVDPSTGEAPRVVGVASRSGHGCTGGSIETRVDRHLAWIDAVADLPCGSGPREACPADEASGGQGGCRVAVAPSPADALTAYWVLLPWALTRRKKCR